MPDPIIQHASFCQAPSGGACGCRTVVLPPFRSSQNTYYPQGDSNTEPRPHFHCAVCNEIEVFEGTTQEALEAAAHAFRDHHLYHTVKDA